LALKTPKNAELAPSYFTQIKNCKNPQKYRVGAKKLQHTSDENFAWSPEAKIRTTRGTK
jgi:hypothetical protein